MHAWWEIGSLVEIVHRSPRKTRNQATKNKASKSNEAIYMRKFCRLGFNLTGWYWIRWYFGGLSEWIYLGRRLWVVGGVTKHLAKRSWTDLCRLGWTRFLGMWYFLPYDLAKERVVGVWGDRIIRILMVQLINLRNMNVQSRFCDKFHMKTII